MTVAARLLLARKEELGLSYRALADATGVTPSFLKLVMDGKSNPSRPTGFRIAKALRLTPAQAKIAFDDWSAPLRAEVQSWNFLTEEYGKL